MHLSANKDLNSQLENRKPRWDWTSAILFMLALYFAAGRLVATDWTDHLLRLQLLAGLAAVFGLALGQSRFPRWAAILLGGAYGAFFIPWQLGLTVLESIDWNERLLSLWGRLLFSVGQLLQKEDVTDALLFLAMMAILLWVLSLSSGYALARHRDAWRATLPLGALIVILHTYDALVGSRAWYLASYMLLTLLLVARMNLLKQKDLWREKHTQLPAYIGTDMLRATLLAAGVLVVLAWVTPTLAAGGNPAKTAWEAITRPWREFRQEFGRAFFSLETDTVAVIDYYGESLPLGRGNTLASNIVLTAEILDVPIPPTRYYWRDRVYDQYENGGWRITFNAEERIEADENNLIFPALEGRSVGQLRITTGRTIRLLHSPTQPLWLSRTADFSYAPNPDGSWDIAALRTHVPLRSGESYEAEAYLSNATVTQLRAAGSDYPDWVLERYLQVPDEISQRTRQLALDLAEGQGTAYDIASAITNWLRENIEYVDSVPLPPSEAEAIDWMLFELQQAFCNYYASAEIIMLRSLGIPARLAVGYAQGEGSESNLLLGGVETEKEELLEGIALESRYYTVRQRDAHAWPEVYFPGIGWVEFEPTVNQTPLVRPIGSEIEGSDVESTQGDNAIESTETALIEEDLSVLEERLAEEEAAVAAAKQRMLMYAALSAAAVLLLIVILWRRYRLRGGKAVPVLLERGMQRLDIQPPRRVRRWARYSRLAPLPRAYMEINSALRRLGAPLKTGDTPGERAAQLSTRLPHLEPVVAEVSERYQHSLFSLNSVDADGVEKAKWAIRLASIGEQVRRWLRKFQEAPGELAERLKARGE